MQSGGSGSGLPAWRIRVGISQHPNPAHRILLVTSVRSDTRVFKNYLGPPQWALGLVRSPTILRSACFGLGLRTLAASGHGSVPGQHCELLRSGLVTHGISRRLLVFSLAHVLSRLLLHVGSFIPCWQSNVSCPLDMVTQHPLPPSLGPA